MAAGTKLAITFTSSDGDFSMSFAHINAEASQSNLQAVGSAIVTNGIIYNKIPTGIKSMKLVTTTEQSIPNP